MQKHEKPRDGARGRIAATSLTSLILALFGLTGCGDQEPADAPASTNSAPPPPSAASSPVVQPPAGPADTAWAAYQDLFSKPPEPPAAWNTEAPDEAAMRAFQLSRGEAALIVADAAHDFYTRFGNDPRAEQARVQERQLLDAAVQLGLTNAIVRLEALEKSTLEDPTVSEDERLGVLMGAAQRTAAGLLPQGEAVARESLEKSAQDLIQKFPHRTEPYQLLLNLVGDGPPEKVRAMVTPLLSTNVPEMAREAAKALLDRLDMIGKPLDLKFTAVDGREIDLAAMKGKVVLVDFWATWCGPCIAELPNVKRAYEELSPKGFEILGISFDQERDALVDFVEQEKMSWPQYFDGKGWENAIGRRFGIQGIPSMWLVDKQGILRDLSARDGLADKVRKLLAAE